MTPIDSLLAAKKFLAASERAELAKDYEGAYWYSLEAARHLAAWQYQLRRQVEQKRRDKGLADTTEVMAEAYRADNRE